MIQTGGKTPAEFLVLNFAFTVSRITTKKQHWHGKIASPICEKIEPVFSISNLVVGRLFWVRTSSTGWCSTSWSFHPSPEHCTSPTKFNLKYIFLENACVYFKCLNEFRRLKRFQIFEAFFRGLGMTNSSIFSFSF